ncbi:hypothetical protein Tco_1513705, partial [Tanacetum coccineum]
MDDTAQNTNNTTIRSILLAEKLTGLNFTNWYRDLRIVLRVRSIRTGKNRKGQKGKDKEKNKLAYALKPKISPPPKREHPAKDFVCHHCKELKKIKSDNIASTSGIFTRELYVFPNNTWVYDTGCGTHIF